MSTTPITSPSIDQQVQYMSADAPLQASIVNIWADGPVDIQVNDPSLPTPFLVRRMPYVPYGTTYTPPIDPITNTVLDPRYVTQITTGDGMPASEIEDTNPTIGGSDGLTAGTEPLES
jgi:hypothetical protein